MAVTTLAEIPVGWLPIEVGPRPFPDGGGLNKWWAVNLNLLNVMELCVQKGEGGITWFGKLERSFSGPIGMFGY